MAVDRILGLGRRAPRQIAPENAPVGKDPERVMDRRAPDGARFPPDEVPDLVGRSVRHGRRSLQNCRTRRGRLPAVLADQARRFDRSFIGYVSTLCLIPALANSRKQLGATDVGPAVPLPTFGRTGRHSNAAPARSVDPHFPYHMPWVVGPEVSRRVRPPSPGPATLARQPGRRCPPKGAGPHRIRGNARHAKTLLGRPACSGGEAAWSPTRLPTPLRSWGRSTRRGAWPG